MSIAAQEYKNIEIIVVDDASSDDTCSVAEHTLARFGCNFKIIKHDTNMGVSAARNTGFDVASGCYVIFFDADDMADPDFVSALFEAVTKNDSDAAFCGYRLRFEDTGKEQAVPVALNPSLKYSAEELTVMYILGQIKLAHMAAIFKTSFLKAIELKFTVGSWFGEDAEFVKKAFSRCGSIGFSIGCHYIYIQHENMASVSTKQNKDKSLLRNENNAEAICRSARYLAEFAESPKVRRLAMDYVLAEGLMKSLNVMVRRRDKEQFLRLLNAPGTRWALLAVLKHVLKNSRLFVNAVALLVAPRLYFGIKLKLWG